MKTLMSLLMSAPGDAPVLDPSRLAEQPVRKRLLGLIDQRPGIHASELAREMDESWGTVQYHLSLLRQADLVTTVEVGRECRFFNDGMDPSKARLLGLFHQGRRSEIAEFIHAHPGSRQVDICNALGVSRKTFRSSIRPLIEEGLVDEQRGLHANRYFAQDALDDVLDAAVS